MRQLFERMNAHLAASAFSVLVLCTPLLVVAASAFLLWVGHNTVFGWILAAMLLGLAWVLTPRRPRNTKTTYRRDDLPELFDLLDQVCADLDAPQIDGVHFMTDMNAYLFEYRPFLGRNATSWGLAWCFGIRWPHKNVWR